jgi:hypothetical protein
MFHGNFVALRRRTHKVEGEGIDSIICLGDIAELGPQPAESIECIRSLNCPVVLGTTDARLASCSAPMAPGPS